MITDRKDARQTGQELVMVIARALVGNTLHQKGSATYQRPPCMISGCNEEHKEECYHSVFETFNTVMGTHKDGGVRLNFREFVVYDNIAYPEFIVKYKRV